MRNASKWLVLLLTVAIVAGIAGVSGCSSTPAPTTTTTTTETSSTPAANYTLVTPGTLTIGSDTSFPPFESMNGNTAEGFDVDLTAAIAKQDGPDRRSSRRTSSTALSRR